MSLSPSHSTFFYHRPATLPADMVLSQPSLLGIPFEIRAMILLEVALHNWFQPLLCKAGLGDDWQPEDPGLLPAAMMLGLFTKLFTTSTANFEEVELRLAGKMVSRPKW